MKKISVDQLNEGMIVDDSVSDLHGTILMQKGTAITQNGIKILKMWGVLEVCIDDASAEEHPLSLGLLIDPRFQEEAKRDVDVLFQHVNRSNMFVKEMMRLAIDRITKSRSDRG